MSWSIELSPSFTLTPPLIRNLLFYPAKWPTAVPTEYLTIRIKRTIHLNWPPGIMLIERIVISPKLIPSYGPPDTIFSKTPSLLPVVLFARIRGITRIRDETNALFADFEKIRRAKVGDWAAWDVGEPFGREKDRIVFVAVVVELKLAGCRRFTGLEAGLEVDLLLAEEMGCAVHAREGDKVFWIAHVCPLAAGQNGNCGVFWRRRVGSWLAVTEFEGCCAAIGDLGARFGHGVAVIGTDRRGVERREDFLAAASASPFWFGFPGEGELIIAIGATSACILWGDLGVHLVIL